MPHVVVVEADDRPLFEAEIGSSIELAVLLFTLDLADRRVQAIHWEDFKNLIEGLFL